MFSVRIFSYTYYFILITKFNSENIIRGIGFFFLRYLNFLVCYNRFLIAIFMIFDYSTIIIQNTSTKEGNIWQFPVDIKNLHHIVLRKKKKKLEFSYTFKLQYECEIVSNTCCYYTIIYQYGSYNY